MLSLNIASFLGICGAITASGLFFPQVWSSYKSKKTDGIAWPGIYIGLLNGIFWTSYGFLKGDPIIYITNTLFFVGAFLLFLLKVKHG